MFLLESEIPSAVECFAQKFADILRRHRVLFGKEVFAARQVPRGPEIFRLRQILLNLTLRLREAYVSRGSRPSRPRVCSPTRSGRCAPTAATLLELEGNTDLRFRRRTGGVCGLGRRVGRGAPRSSPPTSASRSPTPRQALVQVIDAGRDHRGARRKAGMRAP